MARVMGITLPAGWDIIYNKTLKMYDISVLCNVGKNPRWFPRKKFVSLKEVTYLFSIAYSWGLMSDDQKSEWNYASNVIGQHNYNLYVQDKSYRMKNGIGGNTTPSLYHQFTVGHINIADPADSTKISQFNFSKILFPASCEICYHTNLVVTGADPYCRLSLIYNKYTGGQTIEDVQYLDLPLVSGWDKAKMWIVQHIGRVGRWRIELELHKVTGDIWFDNTIVEYGGEIKLNDPYCLDVVKWWKIENSGTGITFETVYPVGAAL